MKYFSQLKAALFLASLYPLLRLFWLAYADRLGANPIEFITRSLGTWTLVFLLITLSITPMRNLSGWPALIRLRRMAGLFAFFYALLHFITYLWLDQFFDLEAIYRDVIKRPFITLGFAAFVLMIPLAITSTNAMMKKLGGKRWQILHRLVYAVAIFAVLHYWWLVKKDITQPLIYAAVLAVLLAYRLWMMRKKTGINKNS
ncbi:MAG: sulfoxide reductase heme-binding subunit YedZ [Gallionellales bacterium 35-53-114]|nr:MAG: sulfoxide reductase heme-binding subunit YedZ [Gallionellales bacterium 35-53-114]OYZ62997.1 MAG: sulfoxide reductase heme-binding subunit YedZ [Gallionellales bacterium 24-53-125]OZB09022.1 MAG: sulfoxide reductase heme-binding subunit YedZ [Gallionellales bacterium 39-52-133]HQS59295.1 protein-methionine-sulfoxide reductase heme-binding subunit MsrQ [Gallionellaceae bacterium]HQS76208.1 protein-methionine-sulfoxide reductase heme-binding subunit MsrQ [Gallionellaceae bacterium]